MSTARNVRTGDALLPDGWSRPSGYSQGVSVRGRQVFIAGQVGWNPITQQFETDNIVAQVRQTLQNILAILHEAQAEASHLVRLTWFITDLSAYKTNLRAIGLAYTEVLGRHYPPMSIFVVSEFVEDGAKVEIEATAVVPD